MKRIILLLVLVCATTISKAQTLEELKAEQAPKKAKIAELQAEVNAIQSKINAIPGWKKGAFGTIGGSISEFSNWYGQGTPNNASGNIGVTVKFFCEIEACCHDFNSHLRGIVWNQDIYQLIIF